MRSKDLLTYTLIACMSVAGGIAAFYFQNKNDVVVKVSTSPRYIMNKQPIGSLIPDLPLTNILQQKSTLYDYKTDFVLINFWATWCPPCLREMPILKKLNQDNNNLTVLGFSYDKKSAIIEFQNKLNINYPLFLSTPQTAKLNALFGNSSGGLPYTALLNKEHKIIMIHTGEITEKQILNLIN